MLSDGGDICVWFIEENKLKCCNMFVTEVLHSYVAKDQDVIVLSLFRSMYLWCFYCVKGWTRRGLRSPDTTDRIKLN